MAAMHRPASRSVYKHGSSNFRHPQVPLSLSLLLLSRLIWFRLAFHLLTDFIQLPTLRTRWPQ